jgi:hypothetical protein
MNERPDPNELPASFWMDAAELPHTRRGTPRTTGTGQWKPISSLVWYDSIIDDILANPGTRLKDTAARLGRAATTISSVVSSDLFKARWVQRREQFNQALDERLTRKLAAVAEKGLDAQIEILEKKRDTIPLPVLNETVKNSLDRLGYGPSPTAPPPVVVNNNVVSAEALAKARENLKTIEGKAIDPNPREAGVRQSGFDPREAGANGREAASGFGSREAALGAEGPGSLADSAGSQREGEGEDSRTPGSSPPS